MRLATITSCVAILLMSSASLAERRIPEKSKMKEGLRTTIFDDDTFKHQVKTRYDRNIDFNFGSSAPDPSVKDNKDKKYSLRWYGWLDVPETSDYKLFFKVNGTVKLWLDDEQILEFGSNGKDKETVRPLPLKQGLHFLRVDYSNSAGPGAVSFRWSYGQQKKETVEPKYFFREVGPSE